MAVGSVASSGTYQAQTRVYGSRVTAGCTYTKNVMRKAVRGESVTRSLPSIRSKPRDIRGFTRQVLFPNSPSAILECLINLRLEFAFFSFISNARVSPPIAQRRCDSRNDNRKLR